MIGPAPHTDARRRMRTQPEIILAAPHRQIVQTLATRPRIIGDFIPCQSRFRQRILRFRQRRQLLLRIVNFIHAFFNTFRHRRAAFQRQRINRKMLRRQCQRLFHRGPPNFRRHARQPGDQVQPHVFKASAAHRRHRLADRRHVMPPTDATQHLVVKTLCADAHAIHAQLPQRLRKLARRGRRIQLHGPLLDLAQIRPQTQIRHQRPQTFFAQHGRRAAAKINRLRRQLARRHIRRFHQDLQLAPWQRRKFGANLLIRHHRIKPAIIAFSLAKRHMHIQMLRRIPQTFVHVVSTRATSALLISHIIFRAAYDTTTLPSAF